MKDWEGIISQEYEVVPIDSVQPYPENANVGDESLIAESIGALGFFGAILVQRSTRFVLVGNHRWKVAKAEGLTQLPALIIDCDDDEARRINLIDNSSAARAKRDAQRLLAQLQELGGKFLATGYSSNDLIDLLGGVDAGDDRDPDAAPAPPRKAAVTKPGDVWVLGEHRLVCGDARDPAVLEAVLAGVVPDMVWMDPPYNMAYEGGSVKRSPIENDSMDREDFRVFIGELLGVAFGALRTGGACYVCHGENERALFTDVYEAVGFKLSGILIWKKHRASFGRSDYQWAHEPILYGWKPGGRHRWFGGRKQTTVGEFGDGFEQLDDGSWRISLGDRILIVSGVDVRVAELEGTVQSFDRPAASKLHPTMKPVKMIARHIVNSSRASDVVLDICAGSGSTMIACETSKRSARLVELERKNCDVIAARFQAFTGVVPVRAGVEVSFLEEAGS